MLDLIKAAAVLVPLVALALALLLAVSVLPYITTLWLAERHRVSASRWGSLALVTIVGALVVTAYLVLRTDQRLLVALPPLVFCWLAPGALLLLGDEASTLGGRVGQHEHPPRLAAGTGAQAQVEQGQETLA